jgi:hypothetical protein
MDSGKPTPRKRPRSIRLIQAPGPDGVGIFEVTLGKETTTYVVKEVPCSIGGRGFAVHRLGLSGLYHVRIGEPDECSCECKGFLRHGYCKHVLGLLALVREGQLKQGG